MSGRKKAGSSPLRLIKLAWSSLLSSWYACDGCEQRQYDALRLAASCCSCARKLRPYLSHFTDLQVGILQDEDDP